MEIWPCRKLPQVLRLLEGMGLGVFRKQPKGSGEVGKGLLFKAEWPVTVPPTAQAWAMLPGCSGVSEAWDLGWSSTAIQSYSYPPPRLGMRPRPFLTDGWTDGQKTRVSSYKGAVFHSPTASHHRAVCWQVRVGKELSALPPGTESPSQPGALNVFLLAFLVPL